MANEEYEKKAQELADSFTDEELANIAGGMEMTPEQRKKLATILEIAIPSTAVAAVAIGCGAAALVGKFGRHNNAAYYFKYPFGKNPYGLAPPTPPRNSSKPSPTTPSTPAENTPGKKTPAAMGGVPLTGMT